MELSCALCGRAASIYDVLAAVRLCRKSGPPEFSGHSLRRLRNEIYDDTADRTASCGSAAKTTSLLYDLMYTL